jgi:stage II sporulation protein D
MMKGLGYYILILVFLIFLIPILILGGIGPGIKIPVIVNKIPFINVPNNNDNISESEIKIKVFITEKNSIVEMPLEEYVIGVVAAEMPVNFNYEAIKAQAITARTFAVARMFSYGGKGCVKHPGADVCSEVHCQAWISKEERFKYWKPDEAANNWNKISKAVNDTKGMVISYNKKLASGVKYFSTSDGKTENSLDVFGYSEPYLISVPSPNEEEAPSFKSQIIISKTEFVNKIGKINSKINITSKNLASKVKILDWTDGGRVKNIAIGNITLKGTDMRWAMGLKSTDFSVKIDKTNVTFNVKGYGHGVGMSQWGANEMGKRGSTYNAILKHYFMGTELNKIDDIFKSKKLS